MVSEKTIGETERLQAEVLRVTQERDDLSGEMSACHSLLDRVDPDYEEGWVSAETLETRLKEFLFPEGLITDDMVNGDD